VNAAIIGHQGSGKSTLAGHLLYKCGSDDDIITSHKYKKESEKLGYTDVNDM